MLRNLILVLVIVWIGLLALLGLNMYSQHQVSRQNMRILKDYELKSAADEIFQAYHDSLDQDITLAEQARTEVDISFPLKGQKLNWLLLRVAVILMTILTIVAYWLYYKKMPRD